MEIRTETEHTALHTTLENFWENTGIADYASPEGFISGWRYNGYKTTLERIQNGTLQLIPALNPLDQDLISDAKILQLLRNLDTIVLRLRLTDAFSYQEATQALLNTRSILDTENKNFIVMLDFRVINNEPSEVLVTNIKNLILNLHDSGFLSIYLASGSYPTEIEVGQTRITRWDKYLWECVNTEIDNFQIGFSDYTVVSPLWEETPGMRRGKAAIRYALESEWLVLKGNDNTKGESIRLSKLLINLFKMDFRGKNYSFGDKLIADRTNPALTLPEKKGGNETHLLEGVNHHISLTIKENCTP